MNRIPKRIWCSCQKNVFFSHLGHRPPVVCQFCWECASHTNDVICPNVTQVRAERPAELFFPFFFGRSSNGKHKAMVAHNCHGKTENLTAKTKTSRQNQKPHGKNKIPHGKTKNLTAKPNTSQQKQNSFGFAVGICFPNIRKRIRR